MVAAPKNLPLPKGGRNLAFTTLATILFLLSTTFSLTLLKNKLTNAATGTARLTSMQLAQVGTGLEGEGGADNTVLINNGVTWKASLQATATGNVTITATLPSGNVFDESSISSCQSGSKLAKVNGSLTDNQATCILKFDSLNTQNWSFKAYVYGANGQKLTPTIAINDVAQNTTIPVITLKGEADYVLRLNSYLSRGASNGVNNYTSITATLATPLPRTNGVIGLEPLKDFSFRLDMSNMPRGWYVGMTTGGSHNNVACGSSVSAGVLSCGNYAYTKSSDGKSLDVTVKNAAIGYRHYPTKTLFNGTITNGAIYALNTAYISVPTSSLTSTETIYSIKASDFVATTASGVKYTVKVPTKQLSYSLYNSTGGFVRIFNRDIVGQSLEYTDGLRAYQGENFTWLDVYKNQVPASDRATDVYVCHTWNGDLMDVTGDYTGWTNSTYGKPVLAEYGVISANGQPDAGPSSCGKYGDKKGGFFASRSEAEAYATRTGGRVNAVRTYVEALVAAVDWNLGEMPVRVRADVTVGSTIYESTYISTNKYTGRWSSNLVVVSGKTRLAASSTNDLDMSPSAVPGVTQHIAIIPYVYGQDGNIKATVKVPKGLTLVAGSYKIGDRATTPTVTADTDGGHTLVFNLGSLGTLGGDSVAYPAITFDVTVDMDISIPSTLTINASVTSTGDKNLDAGWLVTSTNIPVSSQESFGYSLSQSKDTIDMGDSITYHFSNFNMTDTANLPMQAVAVLPYDGDGRGTNNITGYTLGKSTISVSSGNTNGIHLYYTTDEAIRADTAQSANTVQWTELASGGTLPANTAAIKWADQSGVGKRVVRVELTIDNIRTNGTEATIATDITYAKTEGYGELANYGLVTAKVSPVTLSLTAGQTVKLDVDKESNMAGKSTAIKVGANSKFGYTLTMRAEGDNKLTNAKGSSIATLPGSATALAPQKLSAGQWGYAVAGADGFDASYDQLTIDSKFARVPSSTDAAVQLVGRTSRPDTAGDNIAVTYAARFGDDMLSGEYSTKVVYTMTAGL